MKKGKVFGNLKKVIVTMVCMVVLLFSMPIKSSAGISADFIGLLLHIPDAIMWIGNKYIAEDTIVTDVKINLKEWDGKGKLYNFAITPYEIFISGCYDELKDSSGNTMYYTKLGLFDANFFTDKTVTSNTLVSSNILSRSVGSVYRALRNFCIIVMLLVLVYIGIKIMISSTSKDESKYKQMLIDWVVGICLLFSMHYIMAFFMTANQAVIKMLRNDSGDTYYIGISELKSSGVISSIVGESGWYDTLIGTKTLAHIMDNQAKGTIKASYIAINPGAAMIYYATVGHSQDVQSVKELEFFANKVVIKNSQKDDDTFYVEQNGHVNINGQATTHGGNVDYSQWGDNGDLYLSATIYHRDHAKYANKAIYKANLVEFARTMSSFTEDDTDKVFLYTSNSLGGKSLKAQGTEEDENTVSLAWGILYLALVIETVMFVIIYFKRVFQLAMYTMIAPFVALMYPIDKVGDGKAQAFNAWIKDYMFTILIQPLHLLLYTVFIGAAKELFSHNVIYAVILYGFMIPAEKYLKKIFGFEKASTGGGSALAGAAGGMLAMRGFDKLSGLGPHGKGRGGSGSSHTTPKIKRQGKPNAPTTTGGGAPTSSGITGGIGSGTGAVPSSSGNRGFFGAGRGTAAGRRNPIGGGNAVPSASNGRRGLLGKMVGSTGRAVRGGITRAITGGKYSNLKGLSKQAIFSGIANGVGKFAVRSAGRAAGVATLGATGLLVGGATAMATGDSSNIAKGVITGVTAGYSRGGQVGDWLSGGVSNIYGDISANLANVDNDYAAKVLADQDIAKFQESGKDLTDDEINIIRAVSPFKDMKGDEDLLEAYKKAFEENHIDLSNISQDDVVQAVSNVINDVGDAKTWGNLTDDEARQNLFIQEQLKKMPAVSDADVDSLASTISDDDVREEAIREQQAKQQELNKQREALEAEYDKKLKNARSEERKRAIEAEMTEKLNATRTPVVLDLDAKKKELARAQLEEERVAQARDTLARIQAIQGKLK